MSFAEFFGCYLGWVLFMGILIIIYIWRKLVTRTDELARLRKKLRSMTTGSPIPLDRARRI